MRPRPLVLAVAALQLVLPLTMLGVRWSNEGLRPVSELPASWQMYSWAPFPTYDGVAASGAVRRLDAGALPPLVRAVGTGRVVPDRLCARHPDLVAVRRSDGPQPGTFRC